MRRTIPIRGKQTDPYRAVDMDALPPERHDAYVRAAQNELRRLQTLQARGLPDMRGLIDDDSPGVRAQVAECVDRFGRMMLEDIGLIFGLSRERVRQIEEATLAKALKSKHARAWLAQQGVEPATEG